MLKRVSALLFGLCFATLTHAAGEPFEAGKHYFVIEPPQPTSTGDKIEVLEVFSYACPACNFFQPAVEKIRKSLPANAEMAYLPAAFRADEDWPVFQRAYYTALALGITDKTHDATFDAVWKDDGPLRISDAKTHRPVKEMPTIEDVAAFYATKTGLKKEDIVGVANSFAVSTRMKRADAMIKATGVDSTPTIIVNGKYRLTAPSAGSLDKLAELVKFLVEKESAGQ